MVESNCKYVQISISVQFHVHVFYLHDIVLKNVQNVVRVQILYTGLYKKMYTRDLKLYMILYMKLYISLYIKRKKGTPQNASRIALVKKE